MAGFFAWISEQTSDSGLAAAVARDALMASAALVHKAWPSPATTWPRRWPGPVTGGLQVLEAIGRQADPRRPACWWNGSALALTRSHLGLIGRDMPCSTRRPGRSKRAAVGRPPHIGSCAFGHHGERVLPARLGRGFRWLLASSGHGRTSGTASAPPRGGVAGRAADGVTAADDLAVGAGELGPSPAARAVRGRAVRLATTGAGSCSARTRQGLVANRACRADIDCGGDRGDGAGALAPQAVAEVFADNATATLTPMMADRDDLAIANARLGPGRHHVNSSSPGRRSARRRCSAWGWPGRSPGSRAGGGGDPAGHADHPGYTGRCRRGPLPSGRRGPSRLLEDQHFQTQARARGAAER